MFTLNYYLALIEEDTLQQIFEQIYHQYRGLMYTRAYDIVQNSETAEDVVHESFIKIAKNMHMVGSTLPERRKALVMRILENTAIDVYRKGKKEQEYVLPVQLDDTEAAVEFCEAEERTLAIAMLKMPLQYQQIFYLKYAHGYNNKEIAQLLGLTVSSIEKTLSRGKKKLNVYLKEAAQI